jgi:hypothetical protein
VKLKVSSLSKLRCRHQIGLFYLDEPTADIMDVFGNEFVSYISNYGYDRVLRILYV